MSEKTGDCVHVWVMVAVSVMVGEIVIVGVGVAEISVYHTSFLQLEPEIDHMRLLYATAASASICPKAALAVARFQSAPSLDHQTSEHFNPD